MSHSAPELIEAAKHTLASLQQASAVSVRAAAALDAGDAEDVVSLLEERGQLFRSCEAAIARLREATDAARVEDGELTGLLEAIGAARGEISELDSQLSIALTTERDRIGRDLDQIDGDELIRSAYGKQTRERARINITR